MDRASLVSNIEKMSRHKKVHPHRLNELQAQVKEYDNIQARHRQSWSDDWHRAIVYCFILFTKVGYLNRERREFLRPTKRALFLTLLIIVIVLVEIVCFALMLRSVDPTYAVPLGIVTLLFQLGYLASRVSKYESGRHTEAGFLLNCVVCEYELKGLDSALGDQLWVGPAVCPECGKEYPAIPE